MVFLQLVDYETESGLFEMFFESLPDRAVKKVSMILYRTLQ